ncbi:hypothetical protein QUA35_02150 [Microcoleus sp. N9_B2]|uniref:hypothetical protein n=1 Tax=unclassified Microcoleus TaxID=2642155 RepID=UPI002FD5E12E
MREEPLSGIPLALLYQGFARSHSQAILTTAPPLVNLMSCGPDSDSPQFAFLF